MNVRLSITLSILAGLLSSCDSDSKTTAPAVATQDQNLIVWADYQYKPVASTGYKVVTCYQGTPAACDTVTATDSLYTTRDTVIADSSSHRWTLNTGRQALKFVVRKVIDSSYSSSKTVHVLLPLLDLTTFDEPLSLAPTSISTGGQWEGAGTAKVTVTRNGVFTYGTESWSLSRTFVKVPTGLSIGTMQFNDVIMVTSSNLIERTTSSGKTTRIEALVSYYAKGVGLIKETGTRGTASVNRTIKTVKEDGAQILSTM